MNLKYADGVPPEGRKVLLSKGGFCHRLPLVAPIPVQGALGQPDMVIISGFGMCQQELCPKWDGMAEACTEAHESHSRRVKAATAEAAPAVVDEAAGDDGEPRRIVTA